MIDLLKSKFGEVGLTFPLNKLEVEEVDYLPEPSAYGLGKLAILRGADKDAQLRSAVGSIALDVYRNMSDESDAVWFGALCSVNGATVNLIESALNDSASYSDAVGSLQSPIARLVAIHMFNALIKSGTSYESAKGISLRTWGGTADLASGKGAFSLLPLLGAYAPVRVYSFFPDSITALVCDKLSCVTHSEVRAAYADVLKIAFNGV